ncbi:MAG TPA: transcriptional regulator [Allosphingosinicella sp.]|nr:transcriptional regulator [Allosphingosinicella sp.]
MASAGYRFEGYRLDPADRRLSRDGVPVELNARYLDALTLLVREAGRLVSKDRFMEEVWRGVPVTDEALTQCIRTLRRQLGDEAASPRFIETVPKHGYRFVAAVERIGDAVPPASPPPPLAARPRDWRQFLLLGGAGTLGAGVAGAIGGLVYGFAGAAEPAGAGAASVLLVLLWLTVAAALMGGAGVSFGIAASRFLAAPGWSVAGGALGGMAVGGAVKLLGLDAFNLLVGRAPGDITGAAEGAALGAAVGFGAWLAYRRPQTVRRAAAAAALAGAGAGAAIPLAGGRLMGGSLDLLARSFPGSRLRLDPLGALVGEGGFGPLSQAITGALEGALFAACIVAAMLLARQSLKESGDG